MTMLQGRHPPTNTELSIEADDWLVLVLRPVLTLARSTMDPGTNLAVDNTRYSEVYGSGVVATCERLLDSSGRMIGIQVWPVERIAVRFLDSLPPLEYIRSFRQESRLELYLGGTTVRESEGSGEQSLSCRLYQSTLGEFAVAIDLSTLGVSTEDLVAIRSAKSDLAVIVD